MLSTRIQRDFLCGQKFRVDGVNMEGDMRNLFTVFFKNETISGQSLFNAEITNCTLINCDLFDCDIINCTLDMCRLSGRCSMVSSQYSDTNISGCEMYNCEDNSFQF